jgi:GYF domain 2/Protein of unknown function (DUF1559)
MYRIIGADQKEYGPVTAEEVCQWIAERRADAQTKVQAEGSTEWKSLGSLPEFAAALAVPPFLPGPPPLPAMGRAKSKMPGWVIALIVLGVVMGLLALLAVPMAMLLPALSQAKGKARSIMCMNNMKQLALALVLYTDDNNGKFPPGNEWCDKINRYVGSPKVFQCPAQENQRCGYAFNRNLTDKKQNEIPRDTVLLFESDAGWNKASGPELLISRHGGRPKTYLVAFADGSVQVISQSRLATLGWEP